MIPIVKHHKMLYYYHNTTNVEIQGVLRKMNSKCRIFGIVCEFNPLHLGHEALLRACREAGADRIVCAMSGNFVQRGEAAVFSKWARAKAAVACGADLVLEIPSSFAAAGAERFALGAVALLREAGVETLAFGVESAKSQELSELAEFFRSERFSEILPEKLKNGVSFPKAREEAAREVLGERAAAILREPNHILAIEYLKAAKTLGYSPEVFAFPRQNAAHDCGNASGFAAKPLREALLRGEFPAEAFPVAAREIFQSEIDAKKAPASLSFCERAILSRLRAGGADAFRGVSDLSEGIENAIAKAAKTAVSLETLYDSAKSKRYSHARIRRLTLAAFLSLRENPALPPYLKPLAANERGRSLLSGIGKTSSLPILTKFSERETLAPEALALYLEECRLTDQYALMLPVPAPCGEEQTHSFSVSR